MLEPPIYIYTIILSYDNNYYYDACVDVCECKIIVYAVTLTQTLMMSPPTYVKLAHPYCLMTLKLITNDTKLFA